MKLLILFFITLAVSARKNSKNSPAKNIKLNDDFFSMIAEKCSAFEDEENSGKYNEKQLNAMSNACQACALFFEVSEDSDRDRNMGKVCKESWAQVMKAFKPKPLDQIKIMCTKKEPTENDPHFNICNKCSEVTVEDKNKMKRCIGMFKKLTSDKKQKKGDRNKGNGKNGGKNKNGKKNQKKNQKPKKKNQNKKNNGGKRNKN